MRASFSSTLAPSIEAPRLLNAEPRILPTWAASPFVTWATLLVTSLPARAAASDRPAELSSYWIESRSASLARERRATSRACATERPTAASASPSSALTTVRSRIVRSSRSMPCWKTRPAA